MPTSSSSTLSRRSTMRSSRQRTLIVDPALRLRLHPAPECPSALRPQAVHQPPRGDRPLHLRQHGVPRPKRQFPVATRPLAPRRHLLRDSPPLPLAHPSLFSGRLHPSPMLASMPTSRLHHQTEHARLRMRQTQALHRHRVRPRLPCRRKKSPSSVCLLLSPATVCLQAHLLHLQAAGQFHLRHLPGIRPRRLRHCLPRHPELLFHPLPHP
jgi:hypothetical protein